MEPRKARLKSLKGRNLFACHEADLWPMPPRTPLVRCEDKSHWGICETSVHVGQQDGQTASLGLPATRQRECEQEDPDQVQVGV